MPKELHPQKTALVCTGLSLPKLNQLKWSASGITNLIPRYSPIVVPNKSQAVALTKNQRINFDNCGSIFGRFSAFF
jgi:hypothetical protein